MSPPEPSAVSSAVPPAVSSTPLSAASPVAQSAQARILLVEDEENYRDPLALGLRRDGFDVVEAQEKGRASCMEKLLSTV